MRPCVRYSRPQLGHWDWLCHTEWQPVEELVKLWGEQCDERWSKLREGFLFQNVTVLGHYETNRMVVLVWPLQWIIPWTALMVVPFGNVQGLLPTSSSGRRGKRTALPLVLPELTSFSGYTLRCRSNLCPKCYVKNMPKKEETFTSLNLNSVLW